MKHSHGWMMWMSALVLSAGGAACGTTVSEPIEAEQHAVSPLATTLLVKDFSTSDATAWCSWYVHTLWWQSGSGPADLPVADGFIARQDPQLAAELEGGDRWGRR